MRLLGDTEGVRPFFRFLIALVAERGSGSVRARRSEVIGRAPWARRPAPHGLPLVWSMPVAGSMGPARALSR